MNNHTPTDKRLELSIFDLKYLIYILFLFIEFWNFFRIETTFFNIIYLTKVIKILFLINLEG